MTEDDGHRAHEDERNRSARDGEISRLRIENIALTAKVRELEEMIARLIATGQLTP